MNTIDELLREIRDYFSKREESDHMEFEGHPLADVQSLMNPDSPAPWDHLTNYEDDEDVDLDVEEE